MEHKPITVKDYQERINRILVYIQEHLDEPILLEDLAKVACFSPFHIHRIFHSYTGETLHSYIQRIKLARAASTLRNTQKSISVIALDAGYDTPAAFTRAFKQQYEQTPTECRKRGIVGRDPDPRYIRKETIMNQEDIIMKPIKITTIEPIHVLFLRGSGPYFKTPTIVWPKLEEYGRAKGIITKNTKRYGMSHDCPEVTPEEKLRYDACIGVDKTVKPDGEFGIQDIPGGKYAVFE